MLKGRAGFSVKCYWVSNITLKLMHPYSTRRREIDNLFIEIIITANNSLVEEIK